MDILILGGTQFVGRHLTQAFLDAGHSVTLFNRGRTNPELFEGEAEKLEGDRDGGLAPLEGRMWDACIDVSGYIPRLVRDAAELLRDAVGHYVFISTISVYAEPITEPGLTEDAPLSTLNDPTTEEVTGETYGGLKVLCEEVVREIFPENHTILRPGIVSGPWDHTDRVTYYMLRLAAGATIPMPAGYFQTIDARDLAETTVACVTRPITGTYNIIADAMPWVDFVQTVADLSGATPEAVTVDEPAILEGMDYERPRGGLPMMVGGDHSAIFRMSNAALKAQGIAFRPLAATVRDTLAWATEERPEGDLTAGLTEVEEQAIIKQVQG